MDHGIGHIFFGTYTLFPAFCALLHITAASSVSVITSPYTAAAYLADLQAIESQMMYPLHVHEIQQLDEMAEAESEIGTVIDALGNEFWSANFRDRTQARELIAGNEYEEPQQRRLFRRQEAEVQAIASVVRWLGVSRITVFLSETNMGKLILDWGLADAQTDFYVISEDIDTHTVELLLRKQVKPLGIPTVVIWLPPDRASKLVDAMYASDLCQNLSDVILSREAALGLLSKGENMPEIMQSGPVFVIDSGCEGVLTSAEFVVCKLQQMDTDSPESSFSVMSIHRGQPVAVGRVLETEITMMQGVNFYQGNSTAFPLPVITISHNNGTQNPSGEAGTFEPFDYVGVRIAVTDINADPRVLPFHTLQVSNVSLGLFEFDQPWAEAHLQALTKQRLGVAMVAGMYSSVTMGVYRLLESNNYHIPQIGASNTEAKLSSKKEFPMYTRVAMSDTYMSVLYGRMMQHYGWKHIVIVYSHDPWSVELYYLISNETQRLGITIHNNEISRQLPSDKSGNYSRFLETYRDVIDTNVRIVILLLYGQTLYRSLEALYDLGMRRGDLLFLATEWISPSIFEVEDPILRGKIKELCHGAVQFYPATKIGDIGVRMSREYRDLMSRDASFYSCFYYDATYLIANAIDFLTMYGGDYTNADTLNHAIRNTRFRGCTGIVTITEGSNDRFPMMYDILNAQVAANGSYEIKRVGTYDPAGLVLFNFSSPILWPDNTTSTPLDMRGSIDCPFEEKDRSRYQVGFVLESMIVFTIFLTGIVITFFAWKQIWSKNADQMNQRAEISFDDYTHFATIGIEALQYASLGLDIPSWAFLFPTISNGLALNLSEVLSLRKGGFWMLMDWVISVVLMWVVLIIVLQFKLGDKIKCLCARLKEIGEMLLPLLGNLCFLPIVCTLLSVFECEEAVSRTHSPTLADTILLQDCYEGCWKFPHTAYVVCCSLLLLLYLPSAILLRPFWQFRQLYLHISTSPSYLMLKTAYQLFIVLLSKTVKRVSYICHSVLFITSSLSFLIITLFSKPYGYGRSNLWHYISLSCLLYLTILCIASHAASSLPSYLWLSLFYSLLALILLFGIIWQFFKIPSMLYRRKGPHVTELFRFMFSRGSEYLHIFNRNSQIKMETQTGNSRHVPTTLFALHTIIIV